MISMDTQNSESFNEVKERLDQIVEAVSAEGISLDDALSLYEEAVSLGMQATHLLEEDIDQEQVDEALQALEESEQGSAEALEQNADEGLEQGSAEAPETHEIPAASHNTAHEHVDAAAEGSSHE